MIEINAIECIQNNKKFYLAIFPKSLLTNTAKISRKSENPEKGFQRLLNEARANQIAKYFESGGVIPSPIILSSQNEAQLQYVEGKLIFNNISNAFLVLDGQHRLYGANLCNIDLNIPVVIFNNLTLEEEVTLFIDINTNQKGVPTTLLLDIKHLTGNEDSLEQKQKFLFDELDKDSIMSGKLSADRSKVGKISRVVFNKATKELLSTSSIAERDNQFILNFLKNYLLACEKIIISSKSQQVKLSSSIFFRAFLAVADDIIKETVRRTKTLKIAELEETMQPLARIVYDNYSGSNEKTYQKVLTDMKNELKQEIKLNDNFNEIF